MNENIPTELRQKYRLVELTQLLIEPPTILCGTPDPNNPGLEEIYWYLKERNLSLRCIRISQSEYDRLAESRKWNSGGQKFRVQQQSFDEIAEIKEQVDYELSAAIKGAKEAPIIRLVDDIMISAISDGATDIHFQPEETGLRIRTRVDGILSDAMPKLPRKIIPAIVARLKILSDLNIAERRVPQDGGIRRVFQGARIDFRVSTLPTPYGEKVVLRILNKDNTNLDLSRIVTDTVTLNLIRQMTCRPYGLVLVTGPTGSGKTTTLYSILKELNSPGVNICTVEDPIEYTIPGLTQVQVLREKGVDFAHVLRSFLRQDPDIILVGETRDAETAKVAVEAANTGHLVFTTLHTNDAASAIARLIQLDVEPFMVLDTLLGVVAQRLVRRVCQMCKGQGCNDCGGAGYKGRVAVFEIMRKSKTLSHLIIDGAPTIELRRCASSEGMLSLHDYGLMLVAQGLTTLSELEKITEEVTSN